MSDVDPDRPPGLLSRLQRVPVVSAVVYIGRESIRFVVDLLRPRRRDRPLVGSSPVMAAPLERSHWDRSAATDRYDLQLVSTPRWQIPIAGVVAMAAALASESSFTFGRRRAIVVDRSSSETVGRFTEPWITDDNAEFSRMIRSYRQDSADDFSALWLTQTDT